MSWCTYGGITPKFLFDTSDLQKTPKISALAPASLRELRRSPPKVHVENTRGVCIALTADWLLHWSRKNPVTETSQLKQGIALSLAQTAYMRSSFCSAKDFGGSKDRKFLEASGVKTGLRERHFKLTASTPDRYMACSAAVDLIGITGPVYVRTERHAMGFYQKHGVIQFFDPNDGCFAFSSPNEFTRWFVAFIAENYAGQLDEMEYIKVRS